MTYSVFQDTMVDMTYQQIEQAAKENLPILFPIGVIEEHGPHLCLGTDTYVIYNICKGVKKGLFDLGIKSLIAPPFYWGINVATNGFAGSFTVKPETMISVLCDTLECLKKWGFNKIFLMNFHGDLLHNLTILESVKKAYEELDIGAYLIVSDFFLKRAGITELKPYMLMQYSKPSPEMKTEPPSKYLDVHAGSFETSLMLKDFPDLVDTELAKTLKSSMTTFDDLQVWVHGGESARKITPLGYCGDPSDISIDTVKIFEAQISEIPEAISDFLMK